MLQAAVTKSKCKSIGMDYVCDNTVYKLQMTPPHTPLLLILLRRTWQTTGGHRVERDTCIMTDVHGKNYETVKSRPP